MTGKCGKGTGTPDFCRIFAGTGWEVKILRGKNSGPGLKRFGTGNWFFFSEIDFVQLQGEPMFL